MESKEAQSRAKESEYLKLINSNNKLNYIISDYFIQKFFNYMHERKSLEIVKYNKNIQKRININANDYESYSKIEIEIIPINNKYTKFININKEEEKYYNIFFNDNKGEIKRNYFNKNDNVSKFKIIIDYQVKSFKELFYNCKCIEYIYFKKFYRNNINNMGYMFSECSSLKELNLSNFNTNSVFFNEEIFYGCTFLKKLILSNFINYEINYEIEILKSSLKDLIITYK